MPHKEFDVNGIGKVRIFKRRGNRSLRLSVAADGIRVTMPTWAPYQAGVAFTVARRAWIMAQQRPEVTALRSGQKIGKLHYLVLRHSPTANGVKTLVRTHDILITYGRGLEAGDSDVQQAARAACWRALRKESELLIGRRLRQLADAHGFSYASISIKRMKSRWGSCDQHQNLVFNLFLVQLPWEYIDYVIMHELTHTRVLHHGPMFWSELERVLPGSRKLRRQMKQYQPALIVA